MTPLMRLDAINISRLGHDKSVENLPHTYSVQVASCVPENATAQSDDVNPPYDNSIQQMAIPSFGSFNIESNPVDGSDTNGESPDNTEKVDGSSHLKRVKCYSTLHHATHAKSRIKASHTTNVKTAKNHIDTMHDLSLSKLVNRSHYCRIELTMRLHEDRLLSQSVSTYLYYVLLDHKQYTKIFAYTYVNSFLLLTNCLYLWSLYSIHFIYGKWSNHIISLLCFFITLISLTHFIHIPVF